MKPFAALFLALLLLPSVAGASGSRQAAAELAVQAMVNTGHGRREILRDDKLAFQRPFEITYLDKTSSVRIYNFTIMVQLPNDKACCERKLAVTETMSEEGIFHYLANALDAFDQNKQCERSPKRLTGADLQKWSSQWMCKTPQDWKARRKRS